MDKLLITLHEKYMLLKVPSIITQECGRMETVSSVMIYVSASEIPCSAFCLVVLKLTNAYYYFMLEYSAIENISARLFYDILIWYSSWQNLNSDWKGLTTLISISREFLDHFWVCSIFYLCIWYSYPIILVLKLSEFVNTI